MILSLIRAQIDSIVRVKLNLMYIKVTTKNQFQFENQLFIFRHNDDSIFPLKLHVKTMDGSDDTITTTPYFTKDDKYCFMTFNGKSYWLVFDKPSTSMIFLEALYPQQFFKY